MSRYSPRPVQGSEQITRFVFSPVHVGKNGQLKPSLFSHAEKKGCSVQRDSIADDGEISGFVADFLNKNANQAWFGVVATECQRIRDLVAPGRNPNSLRAVCVYDTAEPMNPAHAEITRARDFEDADVIELRRELLRLFNDGAMTDRQAYRAGAVWNGLPQPLKDRAQQ